MSRVVTEILTPLPNEAAEERCARQCSACKSHRPCGDAAEHLFEPQPSPSLPMPASGRPPVVVLGGDANALSVGRSLSRLGAAVYVIAEPASCAKYSRYSRWIEAPSEGDMETAWARYLLGPESVHLRGAVLLACSDAGIQVLARHRQALRLRYRLSESNPAAQLGLLDKLSTYRLALAAGVPTPKFWVAESHEQLAAMENELVFPLIVKPRFAHRAKKQFSSKHIFVSSFAELREAFDAERSAAVDVLLMEWVPGGDDQLCSYYTYLDPHDQPLFDFTKRVIRRYPTGMGLGCYHITDHVPEIRELSLRLFRHVGLRGLGNVEFKRDPRDGQYKLIECNARFTAANSLVAASGFDLAAFIYCRTVGIAHPPLETFKAGVRVWDPFVDFLAFLQLRQEGQLSFVGWVKSLLHQQTFAYFRWSDPMPAFARGVKMVRMLAQRCRRAQSIPAQPEAPAVEKAKGLNAKSNAPAAA